MLKIADVQRRRISVAVDKLLKKLFRARCGCCRAIIVVSRQEPTRYCRCHEASTYCLVCGRCSVPGHCRCLKLAPLPAGVAHVQ